jgi:hypothetical protein
MRRLSAFIPALLALWISAATVPTPAPAQTPAAAAGTTEKPEVFSEIDEILADLSKITGLAAPKHVASDTISKDGLKAFLDARIKEVVKPEEIRAEEITLKRLGLVPNDFDLKKMTVDLLTEQAAAFYDYQKKKLFIIDSSGALTQRPVMVHELAHALADFHFNLEKFIKRGKNDDASVARQAVMEGQATWLMSEYILFKMGTSLRKAPEMADAFNQVGGSGAGQGMFPVFDSSPLYLRESLLFPYTKGFSFQQEVLKKFGDQGFKEVFLNPPASVQQILHPEKYFAKVLPTKPRLPKRSAKGFESLIEGGVGELEHQILLRLYAEDQVDLAAKWRGGQVKILENRKTKKFLTLYASEWETEADAQAFFTAYKKILQGKLKNVTITRETPTSLDATSDDGAVEVRLDANRLTSAEGL